MNAVPEFYSPDEVARVLGLHVRTVRRFIREGKLQARRIGKQYRIPAAALAALTGTVRAAAPVPRLRRVLVSTIVDVDAIDRAESDRVTALVTAAFNAARDDRAPKRIDSLYYEEQGRLRLSLHASPAFTASLLTMIEHILADRGAR